MANNEVVKILRVETQGSERTVKSLKEEISSLKDALLNLEKGSNEYDEVVKQLKKNQEDLATVMNAGKQDVEALEGSYNHLVKTMAELKKEWRATTDEVRRNELGQQIDGINTKLKDMDASIGNYQRNVGNYADGFSEAMKKQQASTEVTRAKLESVSKIATGLASGYAAVQGVTALMGVENEKLAKTFVKLQAAIALAQGIGGLKDLVEGIGMAKVAFKGAILGVKSFITSLRGVKAAIAGTGIGLLVVALGMVVEYFMDVEEETEEANKDLQEFVSLLEQINKFYERSLLYAEIETINKYAQAVKNANGDLNKLKQAREEFETQSAVDTQQNLLSKETEVYSKRVQQLVRLNTLLGTNIDFSKTTLENAYSQLKNSYLAQYDSFDEATRRILENYSQNYVELTTEFEKIQRQNAEQTLATTEEYVDAMLDAEKDRITQAQKTKEEEQKLWEERQKEIQAVLDKIAEANRTAQEQELYELEQTYNKEKELLRGRNNDLLALAELYNKQRQEIIDKYAEEEKKKQLEVLQNAYTLSMQNINTNQEYTEQETEVKYDGKETDSPIQAIVFEIERLNELRNLRIQFHNERLQQIDEMLSSELLSAELRMNLETEKANLIRENAIAEQRYIIENSILQKEKIKEEKKLKQQQISSSIEVTKNLLDSTSKLFKQNSNEYKGIASAVATIDALKSANAAYSAMAGIPVVGPALGAAAAAAALVAGYANVKAIWDTDETGSNSLSTLGSSATVTPTFNASEAMPVDYTRNIMTDAEMDEINKPTKVYVLESDITETQNKVEVTESNATF